MYEKIELIEKEGTIKNKIGDPINEIKTHKIYASKEAVRQSEYYQAMATGYKAEVVFVIWSYDYNYEEYLIYNNRKYKIIRTYEKKDGSGKIELTCTSKINENSEVNTYGNT